MQEVWVPVDGYTRGVVIQDGLRRNEMAILVNGEVGDMNIMGFICI